MENKQLQKENPESTQLSTRFFSITPDNEISVYTDNYIDGTALKKELSRLQAAFPEITDDFIIILTERVLKNKFTEKRLHDAINNVIDNFKYKTPNIAEIISFDKRVKLYSYTDILEIHHKTGDAFKYYTKLRVKGDFYYIKNSEKILHNIPDSL